MFIPSDLFKHFMQLHINSGVIWMTEASGSSFMDSGMPRAFPPQLIVHYNLLSAGESVTKREFNKSSPVPHIFFKFQSVGAASSYTVVNFNWAML